MRQPYCGHDYTGERFGYQTVIGPAWKQNSLGDWLWTVQCDCGTIHDIVANDLKKGTKSCGCMTKKLIGDSNKKHGMSHHPAYAVWHSMKQRCTEKTHYAWKNYGGRGIKVCDRWLNSFENFWEDMGPTYKEGLSIDRIDVNGDYSPENCRWTDWVTQSNNKRGNRFINTPKGRMTVKQASREFGIGNTTILYRIEHGWPEELLLVKPDHRNVKSSTSSIAVRGTDLQFSVPEAQS